MSELVILANSYRPGGRCIAGINIKTGKWIRPIPSIKDLEWPENQAPAQDLELLDVIEVKLLEQVDPPVKYQKENYFVDVATWKKIGKYKPKDLKQFVDIDKNIFYDSKEYVTKKYMDSLDLKEWKSLMLVKSEDVRFLRDHKQKWCGHIGGYDEAYLPLKLTDPFALERLDNNHRIKRDCYLSISLAGLWTHPPTQERRCYKLIAGVIEA